MPPDLPTSEFSPADAAALHDCCERFERLCQEGGSVSIEAFVSEFEGELREWAARELAYIADWYRRSENVCADSREAGDDAEAFKPKNPQDETVDHRRTPTGRSRVEINLLNWTAVPRDADRFRELRPFAAGGIGQISVALDLQVQREVALKMLQSQHQDDCHKCDRFCLEAQITGSLEHPGVVPIYALGVDAQQRPYYAMRLIRGKSMRLAIRELHQRAKPTAPFSRSDVAFRDLLRRFVDVCQTMAYAHSRGVLHRDLKPDNVMLGKYGETYVVDWGMARVLAGRGDVYSLVTEELVRPPAYSADSATQYGSAMGTPGYMSPEQAGGRLDELTAATDIYSLGAVLYCILTNRSPISEVSVSEFFRKVALGEIEPPHLVNRLVPPALSILCMKALAVAPYDRYASGRGLAQDIENWMADEPLAGVCETRAERLGRYFRRNYRWLIPLSAASMLIAVIALAAVMLIHQARERAEAAAIAEKRARDRAEAYFVKTRETVDTWLTGYSEALQHIPVAGVQAVRAHMLELAAKEYESFVSERTEDPLIQLEQGRTLIRLGSIHRLLGRPEQAEDSYRQASGLLRRLSSSPRAAPSAAVALALAEGLLALTSADLGNLDEAEAHFTAALKAIEEAASDQATDDERLQALTTLWSNRGGVLAKAGRFVQADAAFERALSAAQQLLESREDDLTARVNVATAQLGAGQIKLINGDARAAARIFKDASDLFAAVLRIDDRHTGRLQLGATAYSYLAAAMRRVGDLKGEQDAYAEALTLAEQLAALHPEAPAFSANVAMMKTDLGQALLEGYDVSQGQELLGEAVLQLSELTARFSQIPQYREAYAAALTNQAHAELVDGKFQESLSLLRSAETELEGLQHAFPEVIPYAERRAVVESMIAQALYLAGQGEEAAASFADATRQFDQLGEHEEVSPDHKYAEAIFFSRYAYSLDGPDEQKSKLTDRAEEAWRDLLKQSSDPQFAAGAAMFFALCDVEDYRDTERAIVLAKSACEANVDNPKSRLALATAYAMAEDWDQLRAHLARGSDEDPVAPALGYFEALALDDAGESAKAASLWKAASSWTAENCPGEWDIAAIRTIAAQRLGIPTTETSTTD